MVRLYQKCCIYANLTTKTLRYFAMFITLLKKTCSNTDCVELSTNDSEIILYRIDIDTIC